MRRPLSSVALYLQISTMWRFTIAVALITAALSCLTTAVLFRGLVDGRIQSKIHAEKICSRSNQGEACEELLGRLWTVLTVEEQHRVACGALKVLADKNTMRIYRRQCS